MEELRQEFTGNPPLALAYEFITTTDTSLFLTGKAGTGKTTFLRYIRDHTVKRCIVLAPTGVAAVNAGGMTLHSFFQLPLAPYLPQRPEAALKETTALNRFSKEKIKIIRSLELLIIDEISMVRADVLDAVHDVLCRFRRNTAPFGGLQVLLMGDVQQLAPVAKDTDWELLSPIYASPYFFDSKAFKSANCRYIELTHIYRQRDTAFIELLERIRNHQITRADIDRINARYLPGIEQNPPEGIIILTTHRHQASRINRDRLEALPGETFRYKAQVEGKFPDISYPTDNPLELKVGAQVMFIKNDTSQEKAYYNGKIGRVTSLEEDEIHVQCPGEDPIRVHREIWTNVHYAMDKKSGEITEREDGRFSQWPLKSAWAVTIHKSQGLTFDRLIVNAADAFAHGQVYVALSRCTRMEGLMLSTPLSMQAFSENPQVREFDRQIRQRPANQDVLPACRQRYRLHLLTGLFDYRPLEPQLAAVAQFFRTHLSLLYPKIKEKWELYLPVFRRETLIVSLAFHRQLEQIVASATNLDSDAYLQERISKALGYFMPQLQNRLLPLLEQSQVEIDNQAHQKELDKLLRHLRDTAVLLLHCQEYVCRHGFTVQGYLKAKANALCAEEKKVSAKKKKHFSAVEEEADQALAAALNAWRSEEAKERNVRPYCILTQKALLGIVHQKPRTEKELLTVYGVGKKLVSRYGREILDRIAEYCAF